MLIDKTKFLALVAAITTASAACIIVDDDDGVDDDGSGGDGAGDTSSSSSGSGSSSSGDGGAGGGGACLDDTGSPAACSSECEALTNCSGVGNLKEGVEEAYVDCVNALDPMTCGFTDDVVNTCYANAAQASCVDAASDQLCASASVTCETETNTAWMDQCKLIADTLNVTGQALLEQCLDDPANNCAADPDLALDICLLDVVFPIPQ